jgi:hypothetical protein
MEAALADSNHMYDLDVLLDPTDHPLNALSGMHIVVMQTIYRQAIPSVFRLIHSPLYAVKVLAITPSNSAILGHPQTLVFEEIPLACGVHIDFG